MDQLVRQLSIVTIPRGTELHLFDIVKKDIARPHFVSSGDIKVLVLNGHGPVYAYFRSYLESSDFMSKLKELASGVKSMYEAEKTKAAMSYAQEAVKNLKENFEFLDDVDALLMAVTSNGKAALLYIHEGQKPDLSKLR